MNTLVKVGRKDTEINYKTERKKIYTVSRYICTSFCGYPCMYESDVYMHTGMWRACMHAIERNGRIYLRRSSRFNKTSELWRCCQTNIHNSTRLTPHPPSLYPLPRHRETGKIFPPSHGRSRDSPAEVAAVMRSISGGAAATRPGWLQAALHSPLHAAQASLPDYGPLRSSLFLSSVQARVGAWMDGLCTCACIQACVYMQMRMHTHAM